MTSILDLLMDYCYLRGFQYSRLDGSMSYADRDENVSFNGNALVCCYGAASCGDTWLITGDVTLTSNKIAFLDGLERFCSFLIN